MVLLETFVDQRFHGTVYRAANWLYLGESCGYRRTRQGYSATVLPPKKVFVKPLQTDARAVLSRPVLTFPYRQGGPKIMMSAQQMRSLPDFFIDIPDPRRAQGRCHSLPTVLAIAAGAILCGMRGYKAIADWAQSSAPRRVSGCAVGAIMAATWCPVNPSCATSLSASTRSISIALYNAGMPPSVKTTPRLPLTVRRCAMPSMPRVIKPM